MSFYRELKHQQIRLATIGPGEWAEPLRCRLTPSTLDQVPKVSYKALSYVWGPAHAKEIIEINYELQNVTVNLACAIRHLRNTEIPIKIWIDALGEQVALMRDIYAGAEEVIVFLGDGLNRRIPKGYLTQPLPPPVVFWNDSRDDSHLQQFRDSLASRWERETWNAFYVVCLVRSLSQESDYHDAKAAVEAAEARRRREIFELLRRLVVESWWQRIWVIQEIAISPKVTICYGNVTAPWEMFFQAAKTTISPNYSLDIEAEHHKVVSRFTRQTLDLENLRMEWKVTKGANLLSLLHRFWDRKATDERDKIYALLGLANEGSLFTPDYSVGVHKLYEKTAIALIKGHRNLSPLSGDLRRKNSQNLASWVRDWSATFEESDYRRMALHGAYNVCSGWGIVASETESEYWTSVAERIDLLVRDLKKPDKQPRGISVQLRAALVDYINFLRQYEALYQQEIEPEMGPLRAYEICAELTFSGERTSYSLQAALKSTDTGFSSVLAKVVMPNEEMAKLQSKIVYECDTDFSSLLLQVDMPNEEMAKPQPKTIYELILTSHWETTPFAEDLTRSENKRRALDHAIDTIDSWIRNRLRDLRASVALMDRIRCLCGLLLGCTKGDKDGILAPSIIKTEELFNSSAILGGNLIWMCHLRSDVDDLWTLDLDPDTLLHRVEYAKRVENDRLLSSGRLGRLVIESVSLAKVWWCGTRLTTWADVDSALSILSDWMAMALRQSSASQPGVDDLTQNTIWRFIRTLVGGIYWRAGGPDRIRTGDYESLSRWFGYSLLPQLHKVRGIDKKAILAVENMLQSHASVPDGKSFDREMCLVTEGRVFFQTEDGRMGLGPSSIASADEIHILPGGQTHFVLRPRPQSGIGAFELLGDCFLDSNPNPGGHDRGDETLRGGLPRELLGALYCKYSSFDDGRRSILLV